MQKAIFFPPNPLVISDTRGFQTSARTAENVAGCSTGEQQPPEDIANPGPGSDAAVMPLQMSDRDPVLRSPVLSITSPE